jgi:hypothetical protein
MYVRYGKRFLNRIIGCGDAGRGTPVLFYTLVARTAIRVILNLVFVNKEDHRRLIYFEPRIHVMLYTIEML